jgi:acyl carrier protein
MDKKEVFEKIKVILVENLGVDASQVTMDARFREDLQADSLDLVELIMEFEEQFGGEISDEDAQKITTVGQAVDYLSKNL